MKGVEKRREEKRREEKGREEKRREEERRKERNCGGKLLYKKVSPRTPLQKTYVRLFGMVPRLRRGANRIRAGAACFNILCGDRLEDSKRIEMFFNRI
ncbi:MAG: hypothetical protein HY913_04040 [Desulfomonile tiedjei]|nr:hypothetical protein [Desulfomonile tiedjei]